MNLLQQQQPEDLIQSINDAEQKRQAAQKAIADKYTAAQNDTSDVDQAKSDARRNMIITAIGRSLEGFARANSQARGGQGVDPTVYNTIDEANRQSVKDAVSARQAKLAQIVQESTMGNEAAKENRDFSKIKVDLNKQSTDATKATEEKRHNLVTESNNKQKLEDKQTPGQNALDKDFAKEYSDYVASGGYADAQKNINALRAASAQLRSDDSISGPVRGLLPDSVRAITNPNAIKVQQDIEQVIQRSMRPILGSQFTEREGVNLIKRSYNSQLPPKENADRLDQLINQLERAANEKEAASKYFEQHGTLTGYKSNIGNNQESVAKKPLTPDEQKELDSLRAKYGR